MTNKELKARLIFLSKKINPITKLEQEKIDKIFDFLDTQVSYIMLDNEALKRENKYLRVILEKNDNNGSDKDFF